MNAINLSIVIPVYNDHHCLAELLSRLFIMADIHQYSLETLLVDDGSKSETWENMQNLKHLHPDRKIVLLRLKKNRGQHYATLHGLKHSTGEILVTLDADLQHRPEDIPILVDTLRNKNCDLLYGICRNGHPWQRRMTSRIFQYLTKPIGRPIIHGSGFRCLTRQLLEKTIPHTNHDFFFLDAIFPQISNRISDADVSHQARKSNRSRYTFYDRLMLFFKITIHHSSPFQRVLFLGLAMTLALFIILDVCHQTGGSIK